VRRGQGQAVLVGLHGRGRARGVGDGVAGGRKVGVAEAARAVVALLVSQPSQGVVGEKGVDAARVGDRLQGVQLQRVTRVRDVGVRDGAVLAGGAQQVGTGRVVAVGDLLAGGGGGRGDLALGRVGEGDAGPAGVRQAHQVAAAVGRDDAVAVAVGLGV